MSPEAIATIKALRRAIDSRVVVLPPPLSPPFVVDEVNFHHHDNPLMPTVRKCPACGQLTRNPPPSCTINWSAAAVWAVLDADYCPECVSLLPREGLRLARKNRIARRLLGPAPTGNWGFAGLGESRRSEEKKVRR